MKKVFLVLAAFLAMGVAAQADPVQIDDAFEKVQKYLDKENLSLTGGPGGRDDIAAFSQEAILFYGEGIGNPRHTNQAQRESMAKRAAVVSAQRALAEYLEGFAIVSDTVVNEGVLVKDVIRSATSAFVKGAQVVVQEYDRDRDMAVAVIKLGMHGPKGYASMIYQRMAKDPEFRKAVATDGEPFKIKPVKLDEKYDGLIIDATGQDFRPALINRIFTEKGEVIYDPAKVSQKVLVEQGCGEYTNSIDKAKAALAVRGVRNPLVVKASTAVNYCDLQVNDEDAATIFSANQKGSFFAAAKVAFVLK